MGVQFTLFQPSTRHGAAPDESAGKLKFQKVITVNGVDVELASEEQIREKYVVVVPEELLAGHPEWLREALPGSRTPPEM